MSSCDNKSNVDLIDESFDPNNPNEHEELPKSLHSIAIYMDQLVKDRQKLAAIPYVFKHVGRLLEKEIARVHTRLFDIKDVKLAMPELPMPEGPEVILKEKIFIPVNEHPNYNFIGRILGPRGMTAQQLEQESGCKIMIRGRGSIRNKIAEEQMRGSPKWDHLSEELHVLVHSKDNINRAKIRLEYAVDKIKQMLVPQPMGEDELKRRQLIELAILKGTYQTPIKFDNTLQQGFTPINSLQMGATNLNAPYVLPQANYNSTPWTVNEVPSATTSTPNSFSNNFATQMLWAAAYNSFGHSSVLNGMGFWNQNLTPEGASAGDPAIAPKHPNQIPQTPQQNSSQQSSQQNQPQFKFNENDLYNRAAAVAANDHV